MIDTQGRMIASAGFCWIGLLLLTPALWAQLPRDIEIGRHVREIDGHGRNDDLGMFQIDLWADVLANASTTNPMYLRIALDNGAVLADTLVAPGPGNAFQPIYLPLLLVSPSQTAVIQAPADTASVVRWVAGENQVWIRFTSPSSTWIRDGSIERAPSDSEFVRFGFGASAALQWARFERDYAAGRVNLPAPVFDPANPTQTQAVSLLFCGDLFHSFTTPSHATHESGITTRVAFFENSLGVTTAADLREITPGTERVIELFDGDGIQVQQRRLRLTCELEAQVISSGSVDLCRDVREGSDAPTLDAVFRIQAACDAVPIVPGSRFALRFPAEAPFAFRVAVDDGGLPVSAEAQTGLPGTFLLAENAVSAEGVLSQAWCHDHEMVRHDGGYVTPVAHALVTDEGPTLAFDMNAQVTVRDRSTVAVAAPTVALYVPGSPVPPQFIPPFDAAWQADACSLQKTYQQSTHLAGLFETRLCPFVEFADDTLETHVLAAFDDNQDGRLDGEEAEQVTALNLTGLGITTLAGVERLTALQRLDAASNALNDLSPLVSLQQLGVLDLRNNLLTDAESLGRLPFLFDGPSHLLDVRGNQIAGSNADCFVLNILEKRRAAASEGVLQFNPQSSGSFYGSLAAWGTEAVTVLDLTDTLNRVGSVIPPYPICDESDFQGGRP